MRNFAFYGERKQAKQRKFTASKCTRGLTCLIYSYFKKGCREKSTRRSRKLIVGGFVFTQVLRGNLKEWHEGPWTYVCEC